MLRLCQLTSSEVLILRGVWMHLCLSFLAAVLCLGAAQEKAMLPDVPKVAAIIERLLDY